MHHYLYLCFATLNLHFILLIYNYLAKIPFKKQIDTIRYKIIR